ncbi:MAG: hypothetical protein HS132_00570 [Planctomycetia bacterium]|nr:hypothetical protein [Planctomycetia bacterium]
MHWSQYDKKERQVQDLSCGDARIYLKWRYGEYYVGSAER